MAKTYSYAAQNAKDSLKPFTFERRAPGADDVQIDILYCGVCHSDLHTARNEWNNTLYPSVPGHEIVGRVTAVGTDVSMFKVGDLAGVGCMVDSCQHCASCAEGEEQYCENGFTGTYNGPVFGGENTFGGYSDSIVVKEKFVLRISHDDSNLAAVAPLLCAGITTYSPLHHWKVGPGKKVGVVGLGGLGHMAVKIAHAMGAHVTLFTTSPTVFNLIFKRRSLAGSLIGGIQETQDMLDFCARHGIVSDIEMIYIQGINEAYERMLKGDVKYRFVIDMDSLKKESHAA